MTKSVTIWSARPRKISSAAWRLNKHAQAALREFGNITRLQEETWEVWRRVWLDQLLQDVRYGCRTLRWNLGFAVVVIVILAVGIGMTTAIFSVVNAVLLRSLSYSNAERLVWLAWYDPSIQRDWAYSTTFINGAPTRNPISPWQRTAIKKPPSRQPRVPTG
jgi:hypothetical protein